tara:strand:+ start:3532 stop:4914 length:1383 start_codon:yes stop_codon:yes gene_type:complete
MSLKARRDALLKSSISINSIRNTVQKFNKGLEQVKKNAAEIVKNTKESNLFKKSLISKDNNFFRIRRENVRRKAREDEIEAASLQGPAKQKGSILTKSTRGFLGRLLDFVGILLIGWAITNLPKIIAALSGVIKLIRRVTSILGAFINTIKNIVVGIGQVISDALSKIPTFDFQKNKQGIEENINRASGGLAKLDQQLVQTSNDYTSFGDEMEKLEEEYKEENNENNEDKNTNNQQNDQSEEEGIEAQQKTISFNVDKLSSDIKKSDSNENEQIDPTKNIKPLPKTDEMPEMEVKPPEEDIKKAVEKNLDTSGVDTKKILDKEVSNKVKGTKTEIPEVIAGPSLINTSNFSDTKKTVENIQGNLASDFNSFIGEQKEQIENLKGSEKNMKTVRKNKPTSVRSKRKKKGNTVFIVEKPTQSSGSSMMASAGSSGKRFNIQKEVQLEQTLMKLQSLSTLKYT